MNKEQKKTLKQKANLLDAVTRIGKAGLTKHAVSEVEKLLVKRKLVKVKILKSALEEMDKKEYAKELAKKTNSEIIDQVGFVVVLYKEK